MASAVNADHADTADTASNALKLGGYDASDYMRKDEVKTIKSSYETLEYDGINGQDRILTWTVPEGVTQINVTTVGGGGSPGYIRALPPNGAQPYRNMWPGGAGGETTENVLVSVKENDIITMVIGTGAIPPWAGEDLSWEKWRGYYTPPANNASGNKGGDTYIMINGIQLTSTIAKGGPGGNITIQSLSYDTPTGLWARWYGDISLTGKNGGYGGRVSTWQYVSSSNSSQSIVYYDGGIGTYGEGGTGQATYTYNSRTKMYEIYNIGGGGGSYGDGATIINNADGYRGGGGCWNWGSYRRSGNGYVKISYVRLYSE